MATIVNYEPLQLRFGGVFPDTSGPDISTFGGDLPSQAGGVLFDEAVATELPEVGIQMRP